MGTGGKREDRGWKMEDGWKFVDFGIG